MEVPFLLLAQAVCDEITFQDSSLYLSLGDGERGLESPLIPFSFYTLLCLFFSRTSPLLE